MPPLLLPPFFPSMMRRMAARFAFEMWRFDAIIVWPRSPSSSSDVSTPT